MVTLTAVPQDGWVFNGWRGALTGNSNPATITMNGDKIITATFMIQPSAQANTATATGTAYSASNAGPVSAFSAVNEATLPTLGKPAGVTFPDGLFSFTIENLTPGQTVTVYLELPSPVPIGSQYWKYHQGVGWFSIPIGSDDGDNMITITLTDGGTGDADGSANGIIVDPGAPGTRAPDNSAPSLTIEVPAENEALQDGVTFKAIATDASDVASVKFSIQNPQRNPASPSFQSMPSSLGADGKWSLYFDTRQLPDGNYLLVAMGEDVLGNWGVTTVDFSIHNWATTDLLPSSIANKAGRTMPIKFSIRPKASVDPAQSFIRNEELTIKIYQKGSSATILQTSTYGTTSTDYRIDPVGEKYITNFKTLKTPATYVVEIYRQEALLGSFEFKTTK
jgi:hypothetical protein